MPVAQVNGIAIHYQEQGCGDPVLMVMGSGASGRVWTAHQVPALVDAGHRVVTFDNRGLPPTDECAGGFDLADMVADTAGLIRALDLGPCHLVGTSLGATIAQEVGAEHPDLVRRIAVLATRCRRDVFRRELSLAERELHDCGVELPASFATVWDMLRCLSPSTLDDNGAAQDWLDILSVYRSAQGPGVRIQMDVGDVGDRRDVCARIRARSLVVAFADDVVNTTRMCREVADAIPDSRFEVLADAGHYGYLERPDAVNDLLLEFLRAE